MNMCVKRPAWQPRATEEARSADNLVNQEVDIQTPNETPTTVPWLTARLIQRETLSQSTLAELLLGF